VSETRTGALAAASAALLFGSSFVATAFALRAFGPLAIGAWRGVVATVLVGALVLSGRVDGRAAVGVLTRAGWIRLLVLGALGGPAFIALMNIAVEGSGATIAAFVAGLYAVLAAVLGPPILGERLGFRAIVAFVVALAGTALLAGFDPGSGRPFGLGPGIGAGLMAAGAFALYLVLTRRWARALGLPGAAVAVANFAACAVVLVPAALIAGESPVPDVGAPDTGLAILALTWLAVGASLAAQLLLIAGVRRLPARSSSAVLLLNPLAASVFAALLLGERLSPLQLTGAGLVLVGIAIATEVPALVGSAWRRAGAVR
jgi:drug/metabolite transporter (DMT)-like permease